MADGTVIACYVGVLLRFAGLDLLQTDSTSRGPYLQRGTDIFRAIVYPDAQRSATLFDDPLQCTDNAKGRNGSVHLNAQAFSVEVVQNVQGPEAAPSATWSDMRSPFSDASIT